MIFALLLMLITLFVLIAGIFLMAKGGNLNKKYGNKLMVARVTFQALTIIFIGILYVFYKNT